MTHIYVEGKEDEELVRALVGDLGLADRRSEITCVGGWNKIHLVGPKALQIAQEGGTNIIIFDADNPATGGGHAHRVQELQAKLDSLGLQIPIFLFPDNRSDGTLESLLVNLVPRRHQHLMACFDAFEGCLNGLAHPDPILSYRTRMPKTRTFAYIDAMPISVEQRERKKSFGGTKFFEDREYWDLNATALQSLRRFLATHIR